jgi:hypothetical protein
MAEGISAELYDKILDALDNEDIETLIVMFTKYQIQPQDTLVDAPRAGFNDQIMHTYLDYVLSYNLSNIIEHLIDNCGLEVTDELIGRSMELNTDTYEFLLSLGYIPQIEPLRMAVRNCFSGIVESILAIDGELVYELKDEDIEYLFSFDMDEETIETIRVLFNYEISPILFIRFLKALKDPEDQYFGVSEEETDIAIEIIEFLESHGVPSITSSDAGEDSDSYDNDINY